MLDITSSIVLYENDFVLLNRVINNFLNTSLNVKLYLIDNSSTDKLKKLSNDSRIEYIFNNSNRGFGKAHNQAITKSIQLSSQYHLILNPDVYFVEGTLESLFQYMNENKEVGQVMPKVYFPNGDLQYLCKLLPKPSDLFIRRFIPSAKKLSYNYELKFFDYDKIAEIPNLSGCFMFIRMEALEKVGGFDERFFMYMEDIDLTRRINKFYKTIFYPYTSIYHVHEKESFKSTKLLRIHINSAIKYFNKYGWFFDKRRSKINIKTIKKLK